MTALMLLGWLAGIGSAASPANPRPITGADSVVAVYTQDWGRVSAGPLHIIVVAWPDGHVVWSEDRIRGGPPYLAGQVPPARVTAVLERVERDGVFHDKRLAQACFGPDSQFTTILVKKATRQLQMDSWHELAEAGGGVVAHSCALTPLSNERRLEMVRKESPEYLYYRVVWGELRSLASSLIPSGSHPVAGHVLMKAGIMTWHETAPR